MRSSIEKGNLARDPMRRQVQSMLKHKVHGIGVLGLASEVNKLSSTVEHHNSSWSGSPRISMASCRLRSPFREETSVDGQIDFVKAAAGVAPNGRFCSPHLSSTCRNPSWCVSLVLWPMPRQFRSPSRTRRNISALGSRIEGIRTLHRAHPNFTIVKLEATAIAIANLLDAVDGGLDVFNGRDGIEMLDSMRAGAVGIIPGGEAFDVLARAFDHIASGTQEGVAEAERLYAKVLPLLILLMKSMDTFLVYGKPVLGHRLRDYRDRASVCPRRHRRSSACARPSAMPRCWASFE